MIRLVRYVLRHRAGFMMVFAAAAAGLAAFYYAVTLDEGTKNHLRKRLSEARKMPGRMTT